MEGPFPGGFKPPKLNFVGDMTKNWWRFEDHYTVFMIATALDNECTMERRIEYLLHFIGERGRRIFIAFKWRSDKEKLQLDAVLAKFKAYFNPPEICVQDRTVVGSDGKVYEILVDDVNMCDVSDDDSLWDGGWTLVYSDSDDDSEHEDDDEKDAYSKDEVAVKNDEEVVIKDDKEVVDDVYLCDVSDNDSLWDGGYWKVCWDSDDEMDAYRGVRAELYYLQYILYQR